MYIITREFRFEAGHRHIGGKPKLPKGYNYHPYRAVITIECSELDENGMTVDFDVIKREVGGWIKNHYDHNFLISPTDPMLTEGMRVTEYFGRKVHVCATGSPSAENLARELYEVAYSRLHTGRVRVVSVTVWETKKCSATYLGDKKW